MEKRVLNYRIIIEKEKYEDGKPVYVAYCPTLGISDYGDTIEETLKSIKEGMELAIESMAKQNEDIPLDHIEEQMVTSAKISLPPSLKVSFA